jgi:hypothetical protein
MQLETLQKQLQETETNGTKLTNGLKKRRVSWRLRGHMKKEGKPETRRKQRTTKLVRSYRVLYCAGRWNGRNADGWKQSLAFGS